MIRLTTSPSQKTGIEMPIRPRTISSGSMNVPRKTAAASPMAIATTTQMHRRADDERERDRAPRP